MRSLPLHLLALLLLAAGCAPGPPPAEPAPAPDPAEEEDALDLATVAESAITAQDAFNHIEFLASDEMRGRDTPSPELELAAEYLAERFQELGLEGAGDDGSFLQWWPFQRTPLDPEASRVGARVGDVEMEWRYADEFFAIPAPSDALDATPLYVPDPGMVMELPEEARGSPLLVSLPGGLDEQFAQVIQAGMQFGAPAVVLIMDDETEAPQIHQFGQALEAGAVGQLPLQVIGLRRDVGQALLEEAGVDPDSARDPPALLEGVELTISTTFSQETDDVPNVVAKLPGSDPELRDTYVVLTAHYDHVGVGPPDESGDSIYSGADDNASGTAALVKVARALAELPEAPARSVIFLAVSGEEKGLLGSAHYAQNPTVPQEGIVANLNMDMVSRNHPDTIHAIGEEYTTLGPLVHEVAQEHPELGLEVAPDPEPEEQAFLRSDHFSFVEQGVPALMLTTWLHDDYHLPSDTPDRIDADKVARVARLAFLFTHRLASDPDPPEWTEEGEELLRGLMMP